jgi:8-amino-7-oxononanoate synthase
MQDDVIKRWTTDLEKGLRLLGERHQRRSLGEIQGINLCSNDYLGLAEHPQLKEAVVRALESGTRTGGTGSRLLSGQTESWRELEEEFAKFAGTEAALFFGSGYAANIGMLAALVGPDDVVYSDLLNHASLIDGMRLSGARKVIYPHLDLNLLEERLRKDAGAPWRRIIVTESIFSMNGDVAPLREIADLAGNYGAAMIVDEAHATGVHGPAGGGLAAQAGILSQVLATLHACGKALGSVGAFVCGPAIIKEHLINHARTFIFSTALPPYLAEQIRAALRLAMGMEREREILKRRSFAMIRALRREGFDTANSSSQIVPVMIGTNEDTLKAAGHLQTAGFAVRGIRPPTVPQGQARLRLSLTSKIDEDDLQRLVMSLTRWQEKTAVKLAARPV